MQLKALLDGKPIPAQIPKMAAICNTLFHLLIRDCLSFNGSLFAAMDTAAGGNSELEKEKDKMKRVRNALGFGFNLTSHGL